MKIKKELEDCQMTKMFKGYTDYTNNEYKEIWDTALIVVDTNILLNFYRYSADTKNEMFKILEKVKERLWIPYQVGVEYFRNRDNVMLTSYTDYDKIKKKVNNLYTELLNEINKKKNNQLKYKDKLVDKLKENQKEISELLDKEKEEKKPNFESNEVERKLLEIFNNSIGDPFPPEDKILIKEEGKRRIENKLPPGYKDNDKEENGDYYIYYSMILKAKEEQKDIIFITDDIKEDWYNEINGEIHGGRYELLNEFYNKTGKLLIMYTSDGFVKAFNKNITKKKANERLVDELINVRNKNIHKEFYINNYFGSLLVNKLNNYKKFIINNKNFIDYSAVLEELYYIIRKSEMSSKNKMQCYRMIDKYKENIKENKGYFNDNDLIILINELIFYNSDNSIDKVYIGNIKNEYINLIANINDCSSQEMLKTIYIKVIESIDKNADKFEMSDTKLDMNIKMKLTRLSDFIKFILCKEAITEETKNEIVSELTSIVRVLDEEKYIIQ